MTLPQSNPVQKPAFNHRHSPFAIPLSLPVWRQGFDPNASFDGNTVSSNGEVSPLSRTEESDLITTKVHLMLVPAKPMTHDSSPIPHPWIMLVIRRNESPVRDFALSPSHPMDHHSCPTSTKTKTTTKTIVNPTTPSAKI
uniref:Uncharacterized protein n=1 Tax=Compsopogon caeruleus TaxID=31354 RepID=A0A7S1XCJ9_9RHOD|mmetsp:Transcript_14608/g.29788  ORF Transcript_14608/g.29788 Transcript_14608/m.29788 type:complete len:140 (+) Transcript_14608:1182-1601(+)